MAEVDDEGAVVAGDAVVIEPGALLVGKYHIDALIGRGGMGSVWRATHVELQRAVAVKVISAAYARLPEARRRFATEARAAALIKSRHVVQIYDNGLLEDGTPFIVMEHLEGRTLGDFVREGPLPLERALGWLAQACRALDRAHAAGVVHRDIKPDNIFLAYSEEEDDVLVKVLDFGVAKVDAGAGEASPTRAGAPPGAPLYVSPEQARGLNDVDHRSDLYSLGQIAYTMLAGKPAFPGEASGDVLAQICTEPLPSLVAAASWLPPALDGWFFKACAREPAERYASAREMLEGLQQASGLTAPDSTAAPRSRFLSTPARPSRAVVRRPSAPGGPSSTPSALASPEPPPSAGAPSPPASLPSASARSFSAPPTAAYAPSPSARPPGAEDTEAYGSAPTQTQRSGGVTPSSTTLDALEAANPAGPKPSFEANVLDARTSGLVDELRVPRRQAPLFVPLATLALAGVGAAFFLSTSSAGGARRGEAGNAAPAVSMARELSPPAEAPAPAASPSIEPLRVGQGPKPAQSAAPTHARPAPRPRKKGAGGTF